MENAEELLTVPELLKELKSKHSVDIDRRTLQYYCSPKWRLLPLPTYQGRHVAHYPRKTIDRIMLILLLRNNDWKLKEIKRLLGGLTEEQIAQIVKNAKIVNKVDWLLSAVTKPGPSGSDLQAAFYNLVKVFLSDCLVQTCAGLYANRSGKNPDEIIFAAREEIQKQERRFIDNIDHLKATVIDRLFEDRKNDILKEFRVKLERPGEDIKAWASSEVTNNIVPFLFPLEQ